MMIIINDKLIWECSMIITAFVYTIKTLLQIIS